jgi:hypothetical protein
VERPIAQGPTLQYANQEKRVGTNAGVKCDFLIGLYNIDKRSIFTSTVPSLTTLVEQHMSILSNR